MAIAIRKTIRKTLNKARKQWREFIEFVLDLIYFTFHGIKETLYKKTLPVTNKYLSRVPKPPIATAKDVRANRIRLNIESSFSSPFNIERFEVEWTVEDSDIWVSVGANDLQQRTVARLKPDCDYKFRVRAINALGVSGWSEVVHARTKIDPKNGGGHAEGYTWEQTPSDITLIANDLQQRTVARLKPDCDYKFRVRAINALGVSGWSEVVHARTKIDPKNGGGHAEGCTWEQTPSDITLMFELPPGTSKRDVRLALRQDWIRVELAPAASPAKVLLEGELYGKVKGFQAGSFWELVKEGGKLVSRAGPRGGLTKSVAPKFDYWRAIIPGQHEIDTHKISSEEAGTGLQMLQPGQYDPDQLRHMGLKGF
ncbi:uncharacterized protein HaLaN_09649 [Haematococcus lacustris]|uniref:Fibronectin type-III domain-containing protein n=1 Tax=Haematococcus lacustris TaxID=44745 RepID=A0A699ZDX0_HAELA|nr:uncharacterized protein HaLaN_09649 [Haematococcus lacustris]